jgi:hypothetical protein
MRKTVCGFPLGTPALTFEIDRRIRAQNQKPLNLLLQRLFAFWET